MLGKARRRRNLRLRHTITLLTVLAVILPNLVACTSKPTHFNSIGANVAVSDGAPKDTKAVAGDKATVIPLMEAVTPQITISSSSKLTKTVKLQFMLDQPLGPNDQVAVASREAPDADWQFTEVTSISSDRKVLTVQTNHFSVWQVIMAGVAVVSEFKKDVVDPLTGDLFAKADRPKCKNTDKVYRDGYGSVLVTKGADTLYWCYGVENSKRVLKVVNRMRYPLTIKHGSLPVLKQGEKTLELKQLAKYGRSDAIILFPRDEADFQVDDLQSGQKVVITSEYDGWADSLFRIEVAAGALLAVFAAAKLVEGIAPVGSKLISGDSPKVLEYVGKWLDVKDCANTLLTMKPGDFIKGCVTADIAKIVFGALKALAKVILEVVFGLMSWAMSQIQVFVDQVTGHGNFNLTIGRATDEQVFQQYIGEWKMYAEPQDMIVNPDHTGALWLQVANCTPGAVYPDCTRHLKLKFSIQGSNLVATVTGTSYTDLPNNQPMSCAICNSLNNTKFYFQFNDSSHKTIHYVDANGKTVGTTLCREGTDAMDQYCIGE